MKIWYIKAIAVCIVFTGLSSCEAPEEPLGSTISALQTEFPNSLNVSGIPKDQKDRSVYSFSDLGGWHSYTLSQTPSGGFVGPFLLTDDNGLWASKQLVTLRLSLDGRKLDWALAELTKSEYLPGRLVQTYQIENLKISQQLIFISDRSTLVQYEILSDQKVNKLKVSFEGNTWLESWNFSKKNDKVWLTSDESQTEIMIAFNEKFEGTVNESVFIGPEKVISLNPNFPIKIEYVQSSYFTEEEKVRDQSVVIQALANPQMSLLKNGERWDGYLSKTLSQLDGSKIDSAYNQVAVKSLNTLINNWRSAAGELKHDGLFPSYAYGGFHGFWAWDSWKHSVGIADIVPALAKDQIKAMYDYQDIDGMIADCIFRDTLIENHNWRDTKPPLSGWAISKVFDATGDTSFVAELYPKLKKYHQWWYGFRDHDQNGICEYGSTDGTRVAAAWESGMDNAVRFDSATMLTNDGGGYSLDQESVDLNAYLHAEKLYLAKLANTLGKNQEASTFEQDAEELANRIKDKFYANEAGYFFDMMLEGNQVDVFGPEGWIPLWARIATDKQARASVDHMMDTSRFNTKVPFPTLDASHPKFNPKKGYWRGPVWLDQFYFGIRGLENYGYQEEADTLKAKLFQNAEGLMTIGPIRENYHPVTGEGLNASHFSWSAAHVLMLIRE